MAEAEGIKGQTCEHTAQVGGKLTLVRYCGYCWAEYLEPKAHRGYFCSSVCSKRNAAWNGWIRDTQAAAISGDVNKPMRLGAALPPAGASLSAAVVRFAVQSELELVA